MPIYQPPIPEQLSRDVLKHLDQLGLKTVKAYRRWCADNGFARALNKNKADRLAELSAARRKQVTTVGDFQTLCRRKPVEALQAICEGKVGPSQLLLPELVGLSKAVAAAAKAKHEPRLDRSALSGAIGLLSKRRAKFIGSEIFQRSSSLSNCQTLLALVRIVQYRYRWVRPLDQWRPKSKSVRRQFESLLHHLFARYEPMPSFFQHVWAFDGPSMARYRQWYVQVAHGENLRKCTLPIPYTRRMAHWFMRAPENFSVTQALRFGQVIGLGGDDRLARAIAATRLSDNFTCEDFWVTVIRWFVDQPLLDPVQIGPIIDYINFQRFATQDVFLGRIGQIVAGGAAEGPRQPNFSMRGRTAATLMRQVNRWHQGLARNNQNQKCTWIPSGISAFSLVEGSEWSVRQDAPTNFDGNIKYWVIRELLSSEALVAEGRSLNHCVASYASSCRTRRTSIWTMEVESSSGVKKLLTIEVCLMSRTIVQVRGKNNRLCKEKEKTLIRRWASEAYLKYKA